MTITDFRESVDIALQHCGTLFDRAGLAQFIRENWPLIIEDPEPSRWAAEFLMRNEPTREVRSGQPA